MVKEKKTNIIAGNSLPKNSVQKTADIPKALSDQELIEKLRDYVNSNRLSWTQLAHQLGVTQNTLTNWNNGGNISARNRRNILALFDDPSIPPVIVDYKSRLEDPISAAMRKVWGTLSELNKARVYMFALECRDECGKNSCSGIYEASEQSDAGEKAAEHQTVYNRKKHSK